MTNRINTTTISGFGASPPLPKMQFKTPKWLQEQAMQRNMNAAIDKAASSKKGMGYIDPKYR